MQLSRPHVETTPLTDRILDIENLTVRFDDNVVVDNVSISVKKGEIMGVLGPNGAGKSCMFRAMLGLLPHLGRVSFFGAADRRSILPLIGYVPQKLHFEPLFPATVQDVVSMGMVRQSIKDRAYHTLKNQGIELDRMRWSDTKDGTVDRVLDIVNMSSMKNRRIGDLSGGQQQRLSIAQALAREPHILIMDEPMGGMDVESQTFVYDAIRIAARDCHITVIMSLHDLDILQKETNSVMFLNRSMIYHGNADDFFSDKTRIRMYTEASRCHCHIADP